MAGKQNQRNKCASGLAAERQVRELLAALVNDDCLILNDVPFPYGNPWIVALLVFVNAAVSIYRPVKRVNLLEFLRSYPENKYCTTEANA